ncbi:TfoX/Sxy family protein [Clostridium tagluense]|uniref:TfoX/Sxy family protein n=1 Tax=Clostridium tagluense TaxID=360422 RepID=UPI001C0E857B|nr:TfoX/Sxy family protein [Clostridium tagluense]MBU3129830.1 TfoX/Sxy family protein [Clostridium tagluense]
MDSSLDFVENVCDQISGAGSITYKKMFGEYTIYCDGKVIGLICENQFFVKKTIVGAELLTSAEEASPYSGAKPHFLIECLEDREFLADFIRKTCDELPVPRPKKKKTII